MAQGASQAAVARRQFELGMGHGLWHTRKRGGNRRGRAQDFLNRCEVDITASCGECRVKAIRREDQTMLSRRSFLKSTLGAGLALATQGCQQMVAQPVRRRTIVDSQVHLWKAESADWPWVPGAKPQLPEPFTIEKLVPMMDEAGVDRVVVVPPSWPGDRNDYALEAAKRFPNRFAVMGRITLQNPKSAALCCPSGRSSLECSAPASFSTMMSRFLG